MNAFVKLTLVFGFFGLLIFAVVSSNVLQRYSYDIYTCKNATLPSIELRFNEIRAGQMVEFKQGNSVKTLRILEDLEGIVLLALTRPSFLQEMLLLFQVAFLEKFLLLKLLDHLPYS